MSIYLVRISNFLWIKGALVLAWLMAIILVILGIMGKTFAAIVFQRQTFQIRIEYWKISLNIIQDHPLFGVGPDKFYDFSATYMAPGSIDLITTTRLDNGHNWYLNVGANYGLFALLSLAAIIFIVCWYAIKLMLDESSKNLPGISSGVSLFGVVLTGIVSIEQPGIGIWLYFFSGVVIASYLEHFKKDSRIPKVLASNQGRVVRATYLLIFVFSVSASAITFYRVNADARLRSEIQNIAINEGSEQTVKRVFELSTDLKAEPEYLVKSLDYLAQLGMAREVDAISEATFNYYKGSIQAALIRADVLKALGRSSEACKLRPPLLENSPWDYSLLKSLLVCSGNKEIINPDIKVLGRSLPYFQDFSYTNLEQNLVNRGPMFSNIERAAVIGRLNLELGNLEQATKLATYAAEQRMKLELLNNQDPAQSIKFNWEEIDALLRYPSN